MRIYLIGYMGSGKTKTAEALAKAMRLQHADTDKMISDKTGLSVAAIFKDKGEAEFRRIEAEIIRSTVTTDEVVISTGGGLPCHSGNMDWMNQNGLTVYLEANAGLLFHRLVRSREGRPLIEHLHEIDLMEQISGHLAVRMEFYSKAKVIVDAASINIKKLAEKIRKAID